MTEILSGINKTIRKSGDDITELTLNRTTDAAGKEIISLGQMPTMKQLDYIKRALSDIAYNSPGVPAVGQILPALSQRAKDALGLVRNKYSTIPIPGSEVTLNGDNLVSSAAAERDALILRLREYFDQTSRQALLERRQAESVARVAEISQVPMTIFIG